MKSAIPAQLITITARFVKIIFLYNVVNAKNNAKQMTAVAIQTKSAIIYAKTVLITAQYARKITLTAGAAQISYVHDLLEILFKENVTASAAMITRKSSVNRTCQLTAGAVSLKTYEGARPAFLGTRSTRTWNAATARKAFYAVRRLCEVRFQMRYVLAKRQNV
uniref:Uncharacterized protein n=1 Tax=Spironucleus salmonicida TaxID=348837 RepID=V6LGN0_9EUKA|eukprot:EST42861.1 Hypothetical protein SS50377_17484 [Spironucleus salmonicida]